MIRIWARKSELRRESQSYRQKVRVTAGRPPESEPNRPEREPESGLGASTENPLKAFLNPPKKYPKRPPRWFRNGILVEVIQML